MSSDARQRIVIDALAARFGGTAYAVIQGSRYLATADTVESVCVVTRAGSIVHAGLLDEERLHVVALPKRRRLELLDRLRWESGRLPDLLEDVAATDCVNVAGILPVGLDVPVTCYLLNPVPFQRGGFGNGLRRRAIIRTGRQSAAVIVPTEAMADAVEPHLGRRPAVVPLGIQRSSFLPAARPGNEILVVADFYQHKRHDLIIEAWLRLPEPRPRLRLVGNPRPHEAWAARIQASIRSLDVGDEIVVEHGLSLHELAERYRSARVFLLASELESFCMPLAEALSSGVPGVVRSSPVLRETGGAGCLYVEGDDPDDWAEALQRVVENDATHRNLRKAGLAHAERYSFDRMGAGLLRHLGSRHARNMDEHPALRLPVRRGLPPWLFPGGLWILLILVLAASVVARDSDRVPNLAPDASGAVAGDAVYGRGLTKVVPSPVPSFTVALGNSWRRLDPPDGRANITPRGTPSRYFQLGFVAYSSPKPARVLLQTSTGEERRFATPGSRRYEVVTLGPIQARPNAVQGVALLRQPPLDARTRIVLSPFDARWLEPGEAVLRQESLRERGPGGVPGQYVRAGSTTRLSITPGLTGAVDVEITASAVSDPARVQVTLGERRRSARIPARSAVTRLGPFRAGSVVRLRIRGPAERVLVSAIKLRAAAG